MQFHEVIHYAIDIVLRRGPVHVARQHHAFPCGIALRVLGRHGLHAGNIRHSALAERTRHTATLIAIDAVDDDAALPTHLRHRLHRTRKQTRLLRVDLRGRALRGSRCLMEGILRLTRGFVFLFNPPSL